MSEGLPELPEGWKWSRLGEVGTLIRGVTYKKNDAATTRGPSLLPLLRATNVSDGGLSFDDLAYVPESLVSDEQRLRAGDIVVVASSGSERVVGRAAQLRTEWDGAFGAFCFAFRPSRVVSPEWVALFMSSDLYRERATALAKGTNINNLKREHVTQMPIPLPPLQDQVRLAHRVGELRRALAEGVDDVESTLGLLRDRVALRRREIFSPGTENWRSVRLGEIGKTSSGGTPNRRRTTFFGGDIPWVKIGDLNEGVLTHTEESITQEGFAASSTQMLEPGTVLLAMYGASIGRAAMLGIPAATNQAICAFEPDPSVVDGEYLFRFLQTQKEVFKLAGYGGAQPNISQRYLREFSFELPPLEVQRESVEQLRILDDFHMTLEAELTDALKKAETLGRAIVDSALAGQGLRETRHDDLVASYA